jgi:hypothetical protein
MQHAKSVLDSANTHAREIIAQCRGNSRVVIARYTAAVMGNFTNWLGWSIPSVRNEYARYALTNNLRCELKQDHIGMLHQLAKSCSAVPDQEAYLCIQPELTMIRQLFVDTNTAGLVGTTVCAVLENTSLIFIPDLARLAEQCGCTDFTYTTVHGEADIEHALMLAEALEYEAYMGYGDAEAVIANASQATLNLLTKIWS